MFQKKALIVFVLAVAGAVFMSGCANYMKMRDSSKPPMDAEYSRSLGEAEESDGNTSGLQLAAEVKQEKKPPLPARMMILTGNMNLEVESFDPVYERIMASAKEMDGYVSSSSSWKNSETGAKSGSVTLRVPSKNFDRMLSEVAKLGTVASKEVKGDDVTEEFVDLKSRLKNLTAEEQQYLFIMKKAVKIPDMIAVEEQLGRIRGEIERITGRMKYIVAMVEYSTLTVSISERMLPALPPSFWKFPETVRDAVAAFLTVVRFIVQALIWFGVFSPFLIVLLFLKRLRAKRKK